MKSPAFQFYVRDWLLSRTVRKMSGDAVKAYIYLLCESWLEVPRATLPTDDSELAAMANLPIDEWMKHKQTVMSSFILSDNRYVNEKLLAISEEQARKSSINRENGKKGGNPAFEKGKHNPYYNPEDKRQDNRKISPATATATATNTETSKTIMAGKILDYLNDKTGKKFQAVNGSLKFILARLREGATEDQCRAVIDLKCSTWLNDQKWKDFLRPQTLFNAEKFAAYVGEIGAETPKTESIADSWINYKKPNETKNLH